MNETQFTITIFILLLLVSSGVAMAAKWVRVPYTLLLVIVGLLISPMHFLPVVHISPELILLIFLPALLFEAAWNLSFESLRENLVPILTLATIGVGLSVGAGGLVLHYGSGLSWGMAFLFCAMISATDPVSVLALFRRLGLPRRLIVIVEGENLFNDGTAVVVFRIFLGIVLAATVQTPGGLIVDSLRQFGIVVFGGLAIGASIGLLAATITAFFDDHLLEITLTTIAAYGSFLLAEGLHVSPVIAVLITGLIIGNLARQNGMSPTTQVAVNSFWEYAAFVVNSLVFLLIGLELQVTILTEHLGSVGWAVLAMLASRLVAVYGLIPLINRFTAPVSVQWRHVLFWGGLRGSLAIALALSLPMALPGRSQLVVMTFGAVIFSLLVQGVTVRPLLVRLGMLQSEERSREYELIQGQLLAEASALAELEDLRRQGVVTAQVYETLHQGPAQSHEELSRRLAQLDVTDCRSEQEHLRRIEKHLTSRMKARLTDLWREGLISEESRHDLNLRFDRTVISPEETIVTGQETSQSQDPSESVVTAEIPDSHPFPDPREPVDQK